MWDHAHSLPEEQMASESQETQPAIQAPDIKFTLLDGEVLPLRSLKRHPILLHFWASWCAPCKAEFHSLLDTVAERKDGAILLAVSADTHPADAERFLLPYQKDFKSLFEEGRVRIAIDSDHKLIEGVFQTFQYPETIEIDPNLTMHRKITGIYKKKDF